MNNEVLYIQEPSGRRLAERAICINPDCNKEFLRRKNSNKSTCSNSCAIDARRSLVVTKVKPEATRTLFKESKDITGSNYSKAAKAHYGERCENCGFSNYVGILEVHHIDENRNNNRLSNLIVLCPNCHAMVTRKCAVMVQRRIKVIPK